MTENAYIQSDTTAIKSITETPAQLADRATWALNSLLESGQDDLVADLAASYESELARLRRAS